MKKMLYAMLCTAIMFAACSSSGKEDPDTPQTGETPLMVSSVPADGATPVDISSPFTISVTMDRNVFCPSANKGKISVTASDGTAATVSKIVANATTITLTVTGLANGTTYTVSFPEGTISGYDNNIAKAISFSFTTEEEETEATPVDNGNAAWTMMKKLGLGWNLGNQMDAFSNGVAGETIWGNPKATQALFTKLKEYGFSSVRIPVTWLGHFGEAPDYTLETEWLERVAEIAGYAKTAGLNAIINTHHDECNNDGHWLDVASAAKSAEKKAEIQDQIVKMWTQIANRFKNEGDWLIFEPFNELHDGGWGWSADFLANPTAQTDVINEWNQAFVDAVRATGGNNATRWLGIAGYAASSTLTVQYIDVPEDDHVMVGFHCYDPSDFCQKNTYQQWGHTAKTSKAPTGEAEARMILSRYYTKFVSKGIPVYMGEFGAVEKTDESYRAYYLEYMAKAARTFGISAFFWDNGVTGSTTGESFGLVNHGTGEYIGAGATIVPVMVKGMTNTDSNYTLETVYNNAP